MVLNQEELQQLPDDNSQNSAMGNQLPNCPINYSGIMNKQLLTAPIKSATDKFQLLPEFLKIRGLVKQHLDSYNYFIETEMQKILDANNIIRMTKFPHIYIRFLKIRVGKPSVSVDTAVENITPQTCRLTDQTYAAPINVDIEYVTSHDAADKRRKNNFCIGRMPIMLRSHSCVLHGKDEAELARLGECPLDPGGYFVIKGTEKVILIQEQLSKNRIILDTDKKGNINASVTASTDKIKTKTVIVMENEKMWVQLNVFPKKVPLMVVMKGMGMESDQEVIQMIGRDPRYSLLLMPSIEECSKNGVYTQQQALEYLDSKAKSSTYSNNPSEKEGRAFRILTDVFLAHVPVHQNNFRAKCIYTAVMMRRMMDAILNKDAMDDKDYVGNKRLELSGQIISLLFEDLFKTMILEVRTHIDKLLEKADKAKHFDITNCLQGKPTITNGLERTLSTGNFDIKRFKMKRKGMTQVLQRLSFISALGQMTRVSPQFEKSRKVSGPRALQPSQWGMLCPCDTPEGEACGLVKNLALMTHVTTDEKEAPLISLLLRLLAEESDDGSSERSDQELALSKVVDGILLGMEENLSSSKAKRGKLIEYELHCREKFSSADVNPNSEKIDVPFEAQKNTTPSVDCKDSQGFVHSQIDEKPIEEVTMLSDQRKVTVLYELLSACLSDLGEDNKRYTRRRKGYDARHRVALRLLATWLDVKWTKMESIETMVSSAAMAIIKEQESKKEETQLNESKWAKWKRRGIIGAAAVTGGTLLAVTGGLAAPAIAAGLGALAPTLGTLIPVIGASGFAAAFSAAGTVAGSVAVAASFGAAGAGLTGSKMARRVGGVEEFEFKAVGENHKQGRLGVEVMVSGFVFEKEDFLRPWEGQHDYSERYALQWESKNLIAVSTAIQDWLTSRLAMELMKRGAMMTVLSTLLTALAWPAALLAATDFIDSKWTIAINRADKAGKLLAKVLLSGVHGNRPVTLVGYSLGARVIFKCLRYLSQTENSAEIVERVVLLGAPIPIKDENWEAARKMVAGRFINAYSRNDWMLGVAFRASLLTKGLSGIQPVNIPGIQNVDVTNHIEGHSSYLWATRQIIDDLQLDTYYPVYNNILCIS